MTTTNMGICFGVSLISSNNQSNGHHQLSSASSTHMAVSQLSSPSSLMLNNHYPHHHHHGNNNENVIMSTKLIDMATATNVFDFLLTNHGELFPGDVNFGSNSLAQRNASFYHRHANVTATPAEPPVPNNPDITNYKHSPSNQHITNTNTSLNTTPNLSDHHNSHHNSGGGGAASHRHSVMLNDSLNTSLNESQSSSAATSQLQNSSYSKFSTAASPSSSLNINHINRHVKNNSIDIRYLDVSENNSTSPTALGLNNTITASNNNNNNNQNKASNVVVGAAFPSISTQINASSTVSLE